VSARSLRHALEHAAFRLTRWTWGWLPERLAVGLGGALGWLAGTVLRVRRPEVDRHLRVAFPDRDDAWRARVARGCYVHLGREASMLFRMPGLTPEEVRRRSHFTGLEEMRRAAEEEGGAILLTGHLGNWEFAGAAVAAHGIGIDVVGKGMANRAFEADLMETRERIGMRVIDMMDAPREVLRSLRQRRVVAMLADQNAHKSDFFLPFFGRDAATVRGPALFAARAGSPVFFSVGVREPGRFPRYRMAIERMGFRPTGDAEADARALMGEYARRLEDAIRAAPEQYFWHHKRWKTRPPEEQAARR